MTARTLGQSILLHITLTEIEARECLAYVPEYRLAVETKKLLECFG